MNIVLIEETVMEKFGWRKEGEREGNFPIFMLFKLRPSSHSIVWRHEVTDKSAKYFRGVPFEQCLGKIHCYSSTVTSTLEA